MKDLCFKVGSKPESKGANSNREIVYNSKQEVLFGSLWYFWYPNIPLEVATTDWLLVKFKVGSETGGACNPPFPFSFFVLFFIRNFLSLLVNYILLYSVHHKLRRHAQIDKPVLLSESKLGLHCQLRGNLEDHLDLHNVQKKQNRQPSDPQPYKV